MRPERRAQWLYGRKGLVPAGPFSILLVARQAKNASSPTLRFMRGVSFLRLARALADCLLYNRTAGTLCAAGDEAMYRDVNEDRRRAEAAVQKRSG